MDVYFIDKELKCVGIGTGVLRASITNRYFSFGEAEYVFDVETKVPVSAEMFYVPLRGECWTIDKIERVSHEIRVSGRSLEALFDLRVAVGGHLYIGALDGICERLVRENAMGERAIYPLVIGESASIETFRMLPSEYEKLSTLLRTVLRPHGAAYKIELDPTEPTLRFRIVKGTRHEGCVICGDALSTERTAVTSNAVYVCGGDGTVVRVDRFVGKDMPINEHYVSARSTVPASFESNEDYVEALRAIGEKKLDSMTESEKRSRVIFSEDGVPGDEYYVYDGSETVLMRLVEVHEEFDHGAHRFIPTFESV